MGRLFVITLEGDDIYSCRHCNTQFGHAADIVSRAFHCQYGKAYLFHNIINITFGEREERMMMTGMHTVLDIFCVGCGSIVGWKYETAHAKDQKYKEGKFILERYKVFGPNGREYVMNQDGELESDTDDGGVGT